MDYVTPRQLLHPFSADEARLVVEANPTVEDRWAGD